MSLNTRVYVPELVRPKYECSMLVLPNEQGAALDDYHGELAKYLSQEIGMRILAFERPYSADQAVFNLAIRRQINAEYPSLASRAASQLNKIVETEGVNQVITSGHSAAGLFALSMAASEQLPVIGSFATDPPAIRRSTPIKAEFIEYGGYQLFSERRKPKDSLPPNLLPDLPPLRKLIERHLRELTGYSAAYRSTLGFETLHRIATQMPEIGVAVTFAETTFIAKPHILRDLIIQSRLWRTNQEAKPFDIKILEGSYHSTLSNLYLFSNLLKHALKKLAPTT